MKSVTYWYQFFTRCEELVPILHGVKFTKCEIYGSTVLSVPGQTMLTYDEFDHIRVRSGTRSLEKIKETTERSPEMWSFKTYRWSPAFKSEQA